MAFVKGQSKPPKSGRKKGSRNKLTSDFALDLKNLNIDVLSELANLIPTLSNENKINVYLKFLDYLYPKLKSENFKSPNIENEISINIHESNL